jgi:hypothetical protein
MRLRALVGLQGISERSKIETDPETGQVLQPSSCPYDLADDNCSSTLVNDTAYSAEGFLTGSFVMYSLTNADLDINITGSVYPSLTEDDRLRAHLEAAVKWEAVSDLSIKLSLNSDYDSGKENEGESGSIPLKTFDYSILLGLEWAP